MSALLCHEGHTTEMAANFSSETVAETVGQYESQEMRIFFNRFFLQVVKAANGVCGVSAPSIKPSCCKQDTSSVYRGCSHATLAFSFSCVFKIILS